MKSSKYYSSRVANLSAQAEMKKPFDVSKFLMDPAPVETLTNGLRVANFSSPHPFTFTDGTVIPACSEDRVKLGSLNCVEHEVDGIKGTTDLDIRWELTPTVIRMLKKLHKDDNVDLVLVPFPVMTAVKESGLEIGKCRVIRVADRITKAIHIDRFCC